jgi:hypothetical protein
MTTDLAKKAKAKQTVDAKVANGAKFEAKLGVAACTAPAAMKAADDMIAGLTKACIPAFTEDEKAMQDKYAALFGRDEAKGAWSAGQVGKEFTTVLAATTHGNLREKMTAVYNASLGGFKTEVASLIEHEAWDDAKARGLDAKKIKRRGRQRKFNPGAKDLFRDPGNPLDRKSFGTYQHTGATRAAATDDDQKTKRTVADLDGMGVGLSDREKAFMYGKDVAPDDDDKLKWKEGGTYWQVNQNNKWVKNVREKLLMPVVAGPSGTALRLFQAWEWLNKPALNTELRLALLGWMLTCNDHSFHEIMLTSADFGMPYTPGVSAYRNVAPLTEARLRQIASPDGFPDEENYKLDHMQKDSLNSVMTTPDQIDRFDAVLRSGKDIWVNGAPPTGGELAHAMAILVYTDEGEGDTGVSAYKFMNNVLKGNENAMVMYYHLRNETLLKPAWDANKFNIKQLVGESKMHAKYMQEGLKLLKPFGGKVYRGYRAGSLPKVGQSWTESKFYSMSKDKGVAEGFAEKGKGKHHILVSMDSTQGRDLGNLSMFGDNEGEVIFPVGSTFSVESAPTPWAGKSKDHHEVAWKNG